jgi:Uma2 family endonuclease
VAVAVETNTPEITLRRLTFDEVLRMSEAGIIDPDERLELDDGVLVQISPESIPHADVVAELTALLCESYPREEFDVRIGTTQPLSDVSYRLPDASVLRRVRGRWPSGDDVLLVVEVAQTSIRRDLGRKARDYAVWGVPEYWVVDLTRGQVVVHRGPQEDGSWTSIQTVRPGERLTLPGIEAGLDVAQVVSPPSS